MAHRGVGFRAEGVDVEPLTNRVGRGGGGGGGAVRDQDTQDGGILRIGAYGMGAEYI